MAMTLAVTLAGAVINFFENTRPDPVQVKLQEKMLSPETLWILEKPDSFTLLSLSPFAEIRRWALSTTNNPIPETGREKLLEHEIIAKTGISDPLERAELITAVTNGLRMRVEGSIPVKFDPYHALQAKREGKTVTLLIAFDGLTLEERLETKRDLKIDKSAREPFDRLFQKYNLLLDDQAVMSSK